MIILNLLDSDEVLTFRLFRLRPVLASPSHRGSEKTPLTLAGLRVHRLARLLMFVRRFVILGSQAAKKYALLRVGRQEGKKIRKLRQGAARLRMRVSKVLGHTSALTFLTPPPPKAWVEFANTWRSCGEAKARERDVLIAVRNIANDILKSSSSSNS